MSFDDLRNDLRSARRERLRIEGDLQRGKEALRVVQSRLERLRRMGQGESEEFARLSGRVRELDQSLPELSRQLREANTQSVGALAAFSAFLSPQQAVENLDDRTPFLLLPVRLEVRFMEAEAAPAPDDPTFPTPDPTPTPDPNVPPTPTPDPNVPPDPSVPDPDVPTPGGPTPGGPDPNSPAPGGAVPGPDPDVPGPDAAAGGPSPSPDVPRATAQPGARDTQRQLWLRIFPDDIHVDTHEEQLTEDEVAAARDYWTEVWRAGGDPDRELGAWRVLQRAYGRHRAAWAAGQYRPLNEEDEEGNSRRPENPLEEGETLDPPPLFPPYEPRLESWSRAPRAAALPDRFVAIGYTAGEKAFEQVGNPIPDPLVVGPDPSHDQDQDEGFKEDDDVLQVDAAMRWMVDFEEAVRVGMGMKIPLEGRSTAGIERLFVLGLRLSDDAEEARLRLEQLIDAHHYSPDGFSLVPQGTPTNNTTSQSSGFHTSELDDDESLEVELGDPLFQDEPDWKHRRDGQYLADALGIDPAVLGHVRYSDGWDQRDARAMNTALWPATLGYFMDEMMDPLFSSETRRQTREFFLGHVRGRGSVPAIRAGDQPYGILPASSLSRWHIPRRPDAGTSAADSRAFEVDLFDFLRRLDDEWDDLSRQAAHAGKRSGDPQQNLLEVLGLHAGSAEFHQRFAISLEQLSNMLKLKQLTPSALDLRSFLRARMSRLHRRFGAPPGQRPDILRKIFYRTQTALRGPLVDDDPLSETEWVKPVSEEDENYLQWLATSPIDAIRRQDFGRLEGEDVKAPRALLYLMLRHAVLNVYWETAWNFFLTAPLIATPPRREPALLYISKKKPGASKFSLLYRQAEELSEAHPAVFTNPQLSVAEQISKPAVIRTRPESRDLHEVRQALECLAERPTAKLARAFGEHVDLCSYRLDAWLQGHISQRLENQRQDGGQVRRGIYLGAFSWLENLRPQQRLADFRGEVPGEFRDQDAPPLQAAAGNGGYIHAPSLNHAVAASVLRNAYITHADRENESPASINLTSERVRMAMGLVEGMQNGQEVGALLGYQFERGLHDRHEEAEVDRFIFALRRKFPLVGGRLRRRPAGVPIQAVEARNVVDGLEFVRHVQDEDQHEYPFGLAGLPPASPAQREVINSEVARMENALDAAADLLMSESVFQVVSGNYERAGSAADVLGRGDNPPHPDIARTPRSGHPLTHRLCLQFDTGIGPGQLNPYPGLIELTPRAAAEPGLNHWLAGLLGPDPDTIVVRVVHVRTGAGPGGEDMEDVHEITLTLLALQPLDLLHLLGDELQQEQSELDLRLAYALDQIVPVGPEDSIRIEYGEPPDDAANRTLFQLMPLLAALRLLVQESRPLSARDLVLPSDDPDDLDPEAEPDPNPGGWNVAELQERVEAAQVGLQQLGSDLGDARTALTGGAPQPADFENARSRLLRAAAHGMQGSIPPSARGEEQAAAEALAAQAEAVIGLIDQRLAVYDELTPPDPEASVEERINLWTEAGKSILGPDFVWMPRFQLKLPQELASAHGDRQHIQRHARSGMDFPAEDWLAGLARVRPKAAGLERVMLLAENFAAPVPEIATLQLPYQPDDFWLALPFPEDYPIEGDKLLLSTVLAAPFDSAAPQAGLLLDEWTEKIPTRSETTGVAFHYDAPDSEPPQCLLLAVTPRETGSWQWDDLLATLDETLDRSRRRAVEPGQIDETRFAHYLPAAMVPATRYLITLATNLLVNVGMKGTISDLPEDEE